MTREDLIALQLEKAQEFEERLAQRQEAQRAYLDSEAYRREQHDSFEQMFAKKHPWYQPQPYISEAEKQAEAEQLRKEKISSLKSQLIQLLTEQENEELLKRLKASNL